MYKGVAILADGSQIETTGTIMEICEWADRIATETGGDVKISVELLKSA